MKPVKVSRRSEQISIPDTASAAGEKIKEIETLLRPKKEAEETAAAPTTREGKLKENENLLRRGGNDEK